MSSDCPAMKHRWDANPYLPRLFPTSLAMTDHTFVPGVPAPHALQRLEGAGGDEITSGKFASPESSVALAVNAFGWFIPLPDACCRSQVLSMLALQLWPISLSASGSSSPHDQHLFPLILRRRSSSQFRYHRGCCTRSAR